MKKLVLSLIFVLLLGISCFPVTNYIENAIDGGQRAIGNTIDTRTGSKQHYYSSSITSTANTVVDLYTYLGRYVSNGALINDSSNTITVNISVDGTNYGNDILLKTAENLDLGLFLIFKKVKVNGGAGGSAIRLLAR